MLVEVDAFWLPDAADAYRKAHVKTSVAVIALDPGSPRLGYFHGTGYHELAGEDYDGLFRRPMVLFPYAEFVKRDGEALGGGGCYVEASLTLLRGHLKRRPRRNPIEAWRAALPSHIERLAGGDMAYFHLYAFNVPRQLGANFEMLGTYLQWLGAHGIDGLAEAAAASRRMAEAARTVQFQLARMAHRRKFDAGAVTLRPIEEDYDSLIAALSAHASPDAGWQLTCTPPGAVQTPADLPPSLDWITAPVPGTAAQALRDAGRWTPEHPYPLHDQDIWYRSRFSGTGRRVLRFDGLATLAEVWLNGRSILVSDNMFLAHEVEVDLAGDNETRHRLSLAGRRTRPSQGKGALADRAGSSNNALRQVRTTLLGHMTGWQPAVHAVGPWRAIRGA